jgi:hypothetical protein
VITAVPFTYIVASADGEWAESDVNLERMRGPWENEQSNAGWMVTPGGPSRPRPFAGFPKRQSYWK